MIKTVLFFLAFSTANASDLTLNEYIQQPAKPLTASMTLNDEQSVEGLIGKAGGSLELKTTDGSTFRLVIPADALSEPTKITMTEVTSFTSPGLLFDQSAIGVQLSPEGLLFAKPARLKINPHQPIPTASLVPITAEHHGAEVRLAAIAPDSTLSPNSIELSLSHFSPYVVTGSPTLRETILKAFNSVAAARLESWTANEITKLKNGQGNSADFITKSFEDYFEKVVKVHAMSVESCEGGMEAQRTLLGWMRQGELLGYDHSGLAHDNFKSVLTNKTTHLCYEKARQACYQDHRVFDVAKFAIGVARQFALLGAEDDPNIDRFLNLAFKCLNFEFVMDSTFRTNDMGEVKVKAHSKIDFRVKSVYEDLIESNGSVQVVDMTFNVEGLDCKRMSLDAPPGEAIVDGFGLKDSRFDQSLGLFIKGFYPRSVGNFQCKDESTPPNVFPLSLPMGPPTKHDSFWGGMFLAFHSQPQANEVNVKKGRYEFFKWEVLYGELFARKKYKRNIELLEEETEMKIFHRPLP